MSNTQKGIAEFVQWMQELHPELIVLEATGGYQRAVVAALFQAGLSAAVVNPARVRQFARASGLLANTDKLDTRVLAEFGRKMQPMRYEGKTEAEKKRIDEQIQKFMKEQKAWQEGGDLKQCTRHG